MNALMMFEHQRGVGAKQIAIALAFVVRILSAVHLHRGRSLEVLTDTQIPVLNAKLVGQQNAPARRPGPGLPVGFLAVEKELLVKGTDGVPGNTADRQAAPGQVALDALRFGGLASIQV